MSENADRESEFAKREEEINFLNKAITSYLVKISTLDIAYKDELIISSYYHVTTDIERIGDHAENILGHAKRMVEEKITFSDEAKAEIANYINILNNLYENTLCVFTEGKVSLMAMVNKFEDEADNAKHQMARAHIQRLNSGLCTAENGAIYLSLATNFERVADHLTNIAESVLTYTKD
jgi:phosphate:Na+ symporter